MKRPTSNEKIVQGFSSEKMAFPGILTLEMMAQFAILSRLKEPENSNIFFHHLMDKIMDSVFKVKKNFMSSGSVRKK